MERLSVHNSIAVRDVGSGSGFGGSRLGGSRKSKRRPRRHTLAETKKPAGGCSDGSEREWERNRKWEMEKENNTKMGNIVELCCRLRRLRHKNKKALLRVE